MNSRSNTRLCRMMSALLGAAAIVFLANASPVAAQTCTASNSKVANVVALINRSSGTGSEQSNRRG